MNEFRSYTKELLRGHGIKVGEYLNLDGADLSGLYLPCVDFSCVDLTGVDLSGANLTRANLAATTLNHACLDGAILSGVYMRGASMKWTSARYTLFSCVDMRLVDAMFSDLRNAVFSMCDIGEAVFYYADHANVTIANMDIPRWDK